MSSRPVQRATPKDADVRSRVVREVEESFIVQAPAGSGKTELLTQRFLATLSTVERPESVVAITFTRKAATEMRNRILDALREARLPADPDTPPHKALRRELALKVLEVDQRLQWHLLDNPSRLQVKTVDALADSIARLLPLSAGVARELQTTEDAGEMYVEAADRVIGELALESPEADSVAALLEYLDNDVKNFRKLLTEMLCRRDQWLRLIVGARRLDETGLQELRRRLESSLRRQVERDLTRLRESMSSILGLRGSELGRLAGLRTNTSLNELPPASASAIEQWKAIADLMLKKDGDFRAQFYVKDVKLENGPDRTICEELVTLAKFHDEAESLCAALNGIANLPSLTFSEEEWKFTRALLVVLPRAVAHLSVVFAERSTVDFIEMAQAARTALRTADGPTELGFALGAKIQHLLMDEFQDTSRTQLDLVNALTQSWEENSGNTMFLVGDPMQSIYSFREAEVTIFTRACKGGGDLRWKVSEERLTANFRSEEGLVEFFNRTHPQILTRDDDSNAAVRYLPADAVRGRGNGDAVVLQGFGGSNRQAEASWIGAQVQKELEDPKATVAILVRARTHLPLIVRELEDRAVKYRAIKIDRLDQRPAVTDLNAIARAIMDIADRTAWLSVLRSPACGLKLDDLFHLCKGDRRSSIPHLIRERASRLSADGRVRAEFVLRILEDAIKQLATESLRLVVERAWSRLGGPASFAANHAPQALQDAEAYLDFLTECEDAGVRPGTARFETRMKTLYAPPATDPEIRVELLTVHGAKGLEWDVVFIPGLDRGSGRDSKPLMNWHEFDGRELLLGPIASKRVKERKRTLADYIGRIGQERAREELKRLFYVATTRPHKRLYLTAALEADKKPKDGTLLSMLWPVTELREAFLKGASTVPKEEATEAKRAPQTLRRVKEVFKATAPQPLVSGGVVERINEVHTYSWAGETRRRIGTVTHAFLQTIANEGLERWTPERIDAARSAIATALRSEGVGPARLDAAVRDVVKALGSTIADERGRWILSSKNEARSEFAITTTSDGVIQRMKLDRTFVEGDVRWIIDFKTSEIEGGDRERFFQLQVEKYRDDLRRYADAIASLDQRAVRCALYFPLENEFRSVPLED